MTDLRTDIDGLGPGDVAVDRIFDRLLWRCDTDPQARIILEHIRQVLIFAEAYIAKREELKGE
jgi:hypothetical protein